MNDNDKPEPTRFTPVQLAIAGLAGAVILVILVIAVSLLASRPG